jgi:carboxypeptidase T
MIKKAFLILIITFLVLSSIDRSFSTGEKDYGKEDSIISMSTGDYRAYLRNNPPLDRLYRNGENFFFLVDKNELEKVEQSGSRVQSLERAEDYIKRMGFPDALSYTSGDINGAYHNYNETRKMLNDLQTAYPAQAKVIAIGYSLEGRELNALKISDNVSTEENGPNIYIIGCHHAREWISVEVPLLFAQYLLEHYNDNPSVNRAMKGSQIYIIPIENPDGLEFSIHTYRMWRKNRRYNGNLSWGVDTNRNYGYKWGIDDNGSSPDPESDVYRGASSFSEPETQAIRDFMSVHPPSGTLSYHNYSQSIIYPWGYTYAQAPHVNQFKQIAAELSRRIFLVNGRTYEYGSSNVLYLTNGDACDWIYGTFGTPAFTIELPPLDQDDGAFFTSEALIAEAFNENLPALLYFVNYFALDEKQSPIVKEPGQEKINYPYTNSIINY